MSSFYQDVIKQDPRFNSTSPIRDLGLLEPVTRSAVMSIITDAGQMGIRLMVTETYRSRARQEALFAAGKTRLKAVGVHAFGLAADFCKLVDGRASWDGDWSFLRDLAERHGLISGYDWGQPGKQHTFVDPGHVQRCSLAMQPDLFAERWYPTEAYNPLLSVYDPPIIS